jgi:hypothetical protein
MRYRVERLIRRRDATSNAVRIGRSLAFVVIVVRPPQVVSPS